MALNAFVSNQGTQTPILTDNTGGTVAGTVIAVQKVDISGQGTAGTLWNGNVGVTGGTVNTLGTLPNVPGGTINLATVQMSSGTLNVATVSTLPNLPGGTLTNLVSGTINAATVTGNLGTIGTIGLATVAGNVGVSSGTINVSTISALPNLPQGSIQVTAGTMNLTQLNGTTLVSGGLGGLLAIGGQGLSNNAPVGNPVVIAGYDSTNVQRLAVDTNGQLKLASNGTLSALASGTISVGTIGGKAASGAAAVGNPVLIGGTDSGGTIYAPLVTSAGALTVTGASAGTFVNISTGTVQTLGTVGTIQNINQGTITSVQGGSIVVTAGTVTTAVQVGTLNVGTINTGTVNVATITGGTLQNLVSGTINAATAVLNSGTINVGTFVMPSGTLNVATISTLPNLPQGSINVTAGTVNTGTINIGTVYKGVAAPTAGSLTAAGTITVAGSQLDAVSWDVGGTWVGTAFFEAQIGTSTFFAIPAITPLGVIGTQTTGNGDYYTSAAGFDNLRLRVTYSSGTLTHNERASNFFAPVHYNLGGTIGNIGMLNAATISSLPNLPGGSIAITAGTMIQTVGTVNTGTVNVATVTAGTINTGTVNTGTINVATITAGSIIVTAGTMSAGTINGGTIQINPLTATNVISHAGTSGTTAIGTLVGSATFGAGTAGYITHYHMLAISGTLEMVLAFGSVTNGAQVIAHGIFPAGGGIVTNITYPHGYGTTNSPITYQILSGSGTASWDVNYFAHT